MNESNINYRTTILFAIDGMRPDGLRQADTPNIDRCMKRSAHTYTGTTVMPSATLTCMTSMFRGVGTERHGITTNTWVPQVRPVPSIIDVAHRQGKRTASFYNWEQLRDLSDPGSLDRAGFMGNCQDPTGDLELAEVATTHLTQDGENGFVFVYLGYTDIAGHNYGWMTDPYLEAIQTADRAIGKVLSVLDDSETAMIITADHGGHEQTHGTDSDEDMTIPWIMYAPGIVEPCSIPQPVSIIDTAPTLADLLGVKPAEEWTGKSVLPLVSTAHTP